MLSCHATCCVCSLLPSNIVCWLYCHFIATVDKPMTKSNAEDGIGPSGIQGMCACIRS